MDPSRVQYARFDLNQVQFSDFNSLQVANYPQVQYFQPSESEDEEVRQGEDNQDDGDGGEGQEQAADDLVRPSAEDLEKANKVKKKEKKQQGAANAVETPPRPADDDEALRTAMKKGGKPKRDKGKKDKSGKRDTPKIALSGPTPTIGAPTDVRQQPARGKGEPAGPAAENGLPSGEKTEERAPAQEAKHGKGEAVRPALAVGPEGATEADAQNATARQAQAEIEEQTRGSAEQMADQGEEAEPKAELNQPEEAPAVDCGNDHAAAAAAESGAGGGPTMQNCDASSPGRDEAELKEDSANPSGDTDEPEGRSDSDKADVKMTEAPFAEAEAPQEEASLAEAVSEEVDKTQGTVSSGRQVGQDKEAAADAEPARTIKCEKDNKEYKGGRDKSSQDAKKVAEAVRESPNQPDKAEIADNGQDDPAAKNTLSRDDGPGPAGDKPAESEQVEADVPRAEDDGQDSETRPDEALAQAADTSQDDATAEKPGEDMAGPEEAPAAPAQDDSPSTALAHEQSRTEEAAAEKAAADEEADGSKDALVDQDAPAAKPGDDELARFDKRPPGLEGDAKEADGANEGMAPPAMREDEGVVAEASEPGEVDDAQPADYPCSDRAVPADTQNEAAEEPSNTEEPVPSPDGTQDHGPVPVSDSNAEEPVSTWPAKEAAAPEPAGIIDATVPADGETSAEGQEKELSEAEDKEGHATVPNEVPRAEPQTDGPQAPVRDAAGEPGVENAAGADGSEQVVQEIGDDEPGDQPEAGPSADGPMEPASAAEQETVEHVQEKPVEPEHVPDEPVEEKSKDAQNAAAEGVSKAGVQDSEDHAVEEAAPPQSGGPGTVGHSANGPEEEAELAVAAEPKVQETQERGGAAVVSGDGPGKDGFRRSEELAGPVEVVQDAGEHPAAPQPDSPDLLRDTAVAGARKKPPNPPPLSEKAAKAPSKSTTAVVDYAALAVGAEAAARKEKDAPKEKGTGRSHGGELARGLDKQDAPSSSRRHLHHDRHHSTRHEGEPRDISQLTSSMHEKSHRHLHGHHGHRDLATPGEESHGGASSTRRSSSHSGSRQYHRPSSRREHGDDRDRESIPKRTDSGYSGENGKHLHSSHHHRTRRSPEEQAAHGRRKDERRRRVVQAERELLDCQRERASPSAAASPSRDNDRQKREHRHRSSTATTTINSIAWQSLDRAGRSIDPGLTGRLYMAREEDAVAARASLAQDEVQSTTTGHTQEGGDRDRDKREEREGDHKSRSRGNTFTSPSAIWTGGASAPTAASARDGAAVVVGSAEREERRSANVHREKSRSERKKREESDTPARAQQRMNERDREKYREKEKEKKRGGGGSSGHGIRAIMKKLFS